MLHPSRYDYKIMYSLQCKYKLKILYGKTVLGGSVKVHLDR